MERKEEEMRNMGMSEDEIQRELEKFKGVQDSASTEAVEVIFEDLPQGTRTLRSLVTETDSANPTLSLLEALEALDQVMSVCQYLAQDRETIEGLIQWDAQELLKLENILMLPVSHQAAFSDATWLNRFTVKCLPQKLGEIKPVPEAVYVKSIRLMVADCLFGQPAAEFPAAALPLRPIFASGVVGNSAHEELVSKLRAFAGGSHETALQGLLLEWRNTVTLFWPTQGSAVGKSEPRLPGTQKIEIPPEVSVQTKHVDVLLGGGPQESNPVGSRSPGLPSIPLPEPRKHEYTERATSERMSMLDDVILPWKSATDCIGYTRGAGPAGLTFIGKPKVQRQAHEPFSLYDEGFKFKAMSEYLLWHGCQHYPSKPSDPEGNLFKHNSELFHRFCIVQFLDTQAGGNWLSKDGEKTVLKDLCSEDFELLRQVLSVGLTKRVGQLEYGTKWKEIYQLFRGLAQFVQVFMEGDLKLNFEGTVWESREFQEAWKGCAEACERFFGADGGSHPSPMKLLKPCNCSADCECKVTLSTELIKVVDLVRPVVEFLLPHHVWVLGPVPNPGWWAKKFSVNDVFRCFQTFDSQEAKLAADQIGKSLPELRLSSGAEPPKPSAVGFRAHAYLRAAHRSRSRCRQVLDEHDLLIKVIRKARDLCHAKSGTEPLNRQPKSHRIVALLDKGLELARNGRDQFFVSAPKKESWGKAFESNLRLLIEDAIASKTEDSHQHPDQQIWDNLPMVCENVAKLAFCGDAEFHPLVWADDGTDFISALLECATRQKFGISYKKLVELESPTRADVDREILGSLKTFRDSFSKSGKQRVLERGVIGPVIAVDPDIGKLIPSLTARILSLLERLMKCAATASPPISQGTGSELTVSLPHLRQALTNVPESGGFVVDLGFQHGSYVERLGNSEGSGRERGVVGFLPCKRSQGNPLISLLEKHLKNHSEIRMEGSVVIERVIHNVTVSVTREDGAVDGAGLTYAVMIDDETVTNANPVTEIDCTDAQGMGFRRICQYISGVKYSRSQAPHGAGVERKKIPDSARVVAISIGRNLRLEQNAREFDRTILSDVSYASSYILRQELVKLNECIEEKWSSLLKRRQHPVIAQLLEVLKPGKHLLLIASYEMSVVKQTLVQLRLPLIEVSIDEQSCDNKIAYLRRLSDRPGICFAHLKVAGHIRPEKIALLKRIENSLRVLIVASPSTHVFLSGGSDQVCSEASQSEFQPTTIDTYAKPPFPKSVDLRGFLSDAQLDAIGQRAKSMERDAYSDWEAILEAALEESRFVIADLRRQASVDLVRKFASERPKMKFIDKATDDLRKTVFGHLRDPEVRLIYAATTELPVDCTPLVIDAFVVDAVVVPIRFATPGDDKPEQLARLFGSSAVKQSEEAFQILCRTTPTFHAVFESLSEVGTNLPLLCFSDFIEWEPVCEWLDHRQRVFLYLHKVLGCERESCRLFVEAAVRNVHSLSLWESIIYSDKITREEVASYQHFLVKGTISAQDSLQSALSKAKDIDWDKSSSDWRGNNPFSDTTLVRVLSTYPYGLRLLCTLGPQAFHTLQGVKLEAANDQGKRSLGWVKRIVDRLLIAADLNWTANVKELSIVRWILFVCGWKAPAGPGPSNEMAALTLRGEDLKNLDHFHVLMDIFTSKDVPDDTKRSVALLIAQVDAPVDVLDSQPRVQDFFFATPEAGGSTGQFSREIMHSISRDKLRVGAPFIALLTSSKISSSFSACRAQVSWYGALWTVLKAEAGHHHEVISKLLSAEVKDAFRSLLAVSAWSFVAEKLLLRHKSEAKAVVVALETIGMPTDVVMEWSMKFLGSAAFEVANLLLENSGKEEVCKGEVKGLEHIQEAKRTKRIKIPTSAWTDECRSNGIKYPLSSVATEDGSSQLMNAFVAAFLEKDNVDLKEFELWVTFVNTVLAIEDQLTLLRYLEQSPNATSLVKDEKQRTNLRTLIAAVWVLQPLGCFALNAQDAVPLRLMYSLIRSPNRCDYATKFCQTIEREYQSAPYLALALIGWDEYVPVALLKALAINQIREDTESYESTLALITDQKGLDPKEPDLRFPEFRLSYYKRPLPRACLARKDLFDPTKKYILREESKETGALDVSRGLSRKIVKRNLYFLWRLCDADVVSGDVEFCVMQIVGWLKSAGFFCDWATPWKGDEWKDITEIREKVAEKLKELILPAHVGDTIGKLLTGTADATKKAVLFMDGGPESVSHSYIHEQPVSAFFDVTVLRDSEIVELFDYSSLDAVNFTYQLLRGALVGLASSEKESPLKSPEQLAKDKGRGYLLHEEVAKVAGLRVAKRWAAMQFPTEKEQQELLQTEKGQKELLQKQIVQQELLQTVLFPPLSFVDTHEKYATGMISTFLRTCFEELSDAQKKTELLSSVIMTIGLLTPAQPLLEAAIATADVQVPAVKPTTRVQLELIYWSLRKRVLSKNEKIKRIVGTWQWKETQATKPAKYPEPYLVDDLKERPAKNPKERVTAAEPQTSSIPLEGGPVEKHDETNADGWGSQFRAAPLPAGSVKQEESASMDGAILDSEDDVRTLERATIIVSDLLQVHWQQFFDGFKAGVATASPPRTSSGDRATEERRDVSLTASNQRTASSNSAIGMVKEPSMIFRQEVRDYNTIFLGGRLEVKAGMEIALFRNQKTGALAVRSLGHETTDEIRVVSFSDAGEAADFCFSRSHPSSLIGCGFVLSTSGVKGGWRLTMGQAYSEAGLMDQVNALVLFAHYQLLGLPMLTPAEEETVEEKQSFFRILESVMRWAHTVMQESSLVGAEAQPSPPQQQNSPLPSLQKVIVELSLKANSRELGLVVDAMKMIVTHIMQEVKKKDPQLRLSVAVVENQLKGISDATAKKVLGSHRDALAEMLSCVLGDFAGGEAASLLSYYLTGPWTTEKDDSRSLSDRRKDIEDRVRLALGHTVFLREEEQMYSDAMRMEKELAELAEQPPAAPKTIMHVDGSNERVGQGLQLADSKAIFSLVTLPGPRPDSFLEFHPLSRPDTFDPRWGKTVGYILDKRIFGSTTSSGPNPNDESNDTASEWIFFVLQSPLDVTWKQWFLGHLLQSSAIRLPVSSPLLVFPQLQQQSDDGAAVGAPPVTLPNSHRGIDPAELLIATCLTQRCDAGNLRSALESSFPPLPPHCQRKNRIYGVICIDDPPLTEWEASGLQVAPIEFDHHEGAASVSDEDAYRKIVGCFSESPFITHVVVTLPGPPGKRFIKDPMLKWCCEYTYRYPWRYIVLVGCDTSRNLPENRDRVLSLRKAAPTWFTTIIAHDEKLARVTGWGVAAQMQNDAFLMSPRCCDWDEALQAKLQLRGPVIGEPGETGELGVGNLVVHLVSPPGAGKSRLMKKLERLGKDTVPPTKFIYFDCSDDRLVEEALVQLLEVQYAKFDATRERAILVLDEYHLLGARKKSECIRWLLPRLEELKVVMIANRSDNSDATMWETLRQKAPHVQRLPIEGRITIAKIQEVINNNYSSSAIGDRAGYVKRFATFLATLRGMLSDDAVSLRLEPKFPKETWQPVDSPEYVALLQDKLIMFRNFAVEAILRAYRQLEFKFSELLKDHPSEVDRERIIRDFVLESVSGPTIRFVVLIAMLVPLMLFGKDNDKCDRCRCYREVVSGIPDLSKAHPVVRICVWIEYTLRYVSFDDVLTPAITDQIFQKIQSLSMCDLPDFPIIEAEGGLYGCDLTTSRASYEPLDDYKDLQHIKDTLSRRCAVNWLEAREVWKISPVTDASALASIFSEPSANGNTIFESLEPSNVMLLLQKDPCMREVVLGKRGAAGDPEKPSYYPVSLIKQDCTENPRYLAPYLFAVWAEMTSQTKDQEPTVADAMVGRVKTLLPPPLGGPYSEEDMKRMRGSFLFWVSEHGASLSGISVPVQEVPAGKSADEVAKLALNDRWTSIVSALVKLSDECFGDDVASHYRLWTGKFLCGAARLYSPGKTATILSMKRAEALVMQAIRNKLVVKWSAELSLLSNVLSRDPKSSRFLSLSDALLLIDRLNLFGPSTSNPGQFRLSELNNVSQSKIVGALLQVNPPGDLPISVQEQLMSCGVEVTEEHVNTSPETEMYPIRNLKLRLFSSTHKFNLRGSVGEKLEARRKVVLNRGDE